MELQWDDKRSLTVRQDVSGRVGPEHQLLLCVGMMLDPVLSLTCLRLHREIGLSLQDAVHQPGAVAVGGVISVCRCHLHH